MKLGENRTTNYGSEKAGSSRRVSCLNNLFLRNGKEQWLDTLEIAAHTLPIADQVSTGAREHTAQINGG
jgi:hypothetical protein